MCNLYFVLLQWCFNQIPPLKFSDCSESTILRVLMIQALYMCLFHRRQFSTRPGRWKLRLSAASIRWQQGHTTFSRGWPQPSSGRLPRCVWKWWCFSTVSFWRKLPVWPWRRWTFSKHRRLRSTAATGTTRYKARGATSAIHVNKRVWTYRNRPWWGRGHLEIIKSLQKPKFSVEIYMLSLLHQLQELSFLVVGQSQARSNFVLLTIGIDESIINLIVDKIMGGKKQEVIGHLAQSVERDSWWGGPGFDSCCGRPLATGWVGVSIMWPAETEVIVSQLCLMCGST